MNTRQKLTIGIAAIFMVTLTIVGVTYAYFVTRVTGKDNGKQTVNVQTAEIASIEYGEGNGVIDMKNVLPGETVYKTFKVTNKDASITGLYDVYISAVLPEGEDVEFVHATDTTTCYTETAYDTLHGEDATAKETLEDACYNGTTYNNIKYTLYQVETLPTTDFSGLTDDKIVTVDGTKISDFVPVGKTKAAPKVLLTEVDIEPTHVHNYVLKVEYINVVGNQNIEQDAALNILVDIVK